MEKSISITPQNPKMAVTVTALRIKNDFISLGFKNRSAFVEIIQSYLPEFKDYHLVKRIELFWLTRVNDKELNEKLETVLNKLRHE